MTRTVRDNALMLQVIAGHDPSDPGSADESVPDYGALPVAPHIEAGLRIEPPVSVPSAAEKNPAARPAPLLLDDPPQK